MGGDGTSVIYVRRCTNSRATGVRLDGGRVERTLGSCPCRGVGRIKGAKTNDRLTYCSGFPVLSTHVLSCQDGCGNDVICRVGVKGSAILLVGGRLRSGGLAQRSGIICRSVLGSPGTKGIGDNMQRLIGGLTRTSTVHSTRTHAVTRRVTRSPCPSIVIYNSFGSSPVSCTRQIVSRSVSSTFARSKYKLNVSCGRGGFCFQVSGVLIDGGLGTSKYAISGSVGSSSRCPV